MPDAHSSRRLESWKDISNYLGCDLRTAMRWEKERGLPVHRLPGPRSMVYAFTQEIDAWRLSCEGAGSQVLPPEAPRGNQKLWSYAGLLLALAIVLGIVFAGAVRPGPAEQAEFEGNNLVARDARGQVAWEYRFPYPVAPVTGSSVLKTIYTVDLDRDGRLEILAVPPQEPGNSTYPGSSIVYCFSDRGKLLWTYEPDFEFRTAERAYPGPWSHSGLAISGKDGEKAIWIAYVHQTWFPSILVRLDSRGRADLRFASSGWIIALEHVQTPQGSYLLAGGINDEYDAASLSVIAVDGPPASSPPSSSPRFTCTNCPQASPFRYYLFPRSELNLMEHAPKNLVRRLILSASSVEIRTEEVAQAKGIDRNLEGIYELGMSFDLKTIAATDLYWDHHRRLEDEGRIQHAAQTCRDRLSRSTIRLWTEDQKWQEIRPRPADELTTHPPPH